MNATHPNGLANGHPPPENHPRRILLAVTGLSPQIVTETLHALAITRDPPFVPTEIHLVTTAQGAERARLALLSDDPGWFHRMRRDFDLPDIRFDAGSIHVLAALDGTPLDDIRTPGDNELAADFITETVRGLTAQADCAVHVSIAGGRKTMGFYVGYALTLFGREQDRLSHVLVSEPFESSWDFFYPTPYSRVITTRNNTLADTRDALVTLAEIPFVSLRHGLPDHLLEGRARYSESVAAARSALGPAELTLDLAARCIQAAGKTVRLPRAELALLACFARLAREGAGAVAAPPKQAPDADWGRRYLDAIRAISGGLADLDQTERTLRKGMDGEYFSSHLSKLRRILRRQLGPAAAPYLIEDGNTRPRRYRLALTPEAVRFGAMEAESPASLRSTKHSTNRHKVTSRTMT